MNLPTTAQEILANRARSRAARARHILDLRHDARNARTINPTLAADILREALWTLRDAQRANPKIRTAADACRTAEIFETALARYHQHGALDYRGSRTPETAARHQALAKSLRTLARDLPIA